MSVQQRYTPEFRSEAVKLVLEQKLSHLVASKRVGIPEGTLASWMAAARSSSKPSAHGSRSTSELLAENSQLCKELAENLLDQTFSPSAPNEVWVTDITYIPTGEGWLYLSGVNDVFTCEIVGYAMSKRMTQELTGKALFRAAQKKRPADKRHIFSELSTIDINGGKRPSSNTKYVNCSKKTGWWINARVELSFNAEMDER